MEQAQVVLNFFIPADQHGTKAIHPTVCALDDLPPSLVADVVFKGLRLFTPGSNMKVYPNAFPNARTSS